MLRPSNLRYSVIVLSCIVFIPLFFNGTANAQDVIRTFLEDLDDSTVVLKFGRYRIELREGSDSLWLSPGGIYWDPATPLDSLLLDSIHDGLGRFGGEANTLSDTGTFNGTEGFGLASTKDGVILHVKGLIEGSNITIAASGDSAYTIAGPAAGGTADSVGIDTDGNGTVDNYLYSTVAGAAHIKKGSNITLTVAGDTVTIAGTAGAGTADSIGVDTDGDGTVDNYMYSTVAGSAHLKEGTGMVLTVAGDTTTFATTLGTSVEFGEITATTSANWAGLVTDETGTGVWVFGTNPTLTTSVGINLAADSNVTIDARTNPRTVTRGAWRINHTPEATTSGTRAVFIDVDANSMPSTEGMHIGYTATGLENGETGIGIDFVGITSNSTGGVIRALEVSRSGIGAAAVHAVHASAGVNPIHQEAGSFATPTQAWKRDTSGTAWSNLTTPDAVGSSAIDSALFDEVDDYLYVGNTATFNEIDFVFNTFAGGPGISPTFEFSIAGPAWTSFPPIDNTDGCRADGGIEWEVADLTSWASVTVNGVASYYIRILRNQAGGATVPIEDRIQTSATSEYKWDSSGVVTVQKVVADSAFIGTISLADGAGDTSVANFGTALPGRLSGGQNDAQFGNSVAGRIGLGNSWLGQSNDTTFNGGLLNLNQTAFWANMGSPASIEFAFFEANGDGRLVIPTSGAGYAMNLVRSGMCAGPWVWHDSAVIGTYWGFDHLAMATAVDGADWGVQNNLQVQDTFFIGTGTGGDVDTITSTTLDGYLTGNETITLSGDVSGTGATAITATITANAVESTMIGPDQVNDLDINFGTSTDQVGMDDMIGSNWVVFHTNGSGVMVQLALGASGDVLTSGGAAAAPTWETPASGIWEEIDDVDDTVRWIAPNSDTALVIESDGSGNTILTVGNESDNSATTLRVKVDTIDISGDVIADFAGTNLSVTAGVLNATGGSGVWTERADTMFLVDTDGDTTAAFWDDDAGNVRWQVAIEDQTLRILLDTIGIGGDVISEFAGTGLTVTSNELTADLGTSIVLGEMDANSVDSTKVVANSLSMSGDLHTFTKAELATQTSDVTEYGEADGEVWTGVHDYGGATSLEIPNGTAPAPTVQGQIFYDTDDDLLEGTDGTNDFVIGGKWDVFIFAIDNPDALACDTIKIPIRGNFPGGIVIDSIGILTSTSTSYSCVFQEWTDIDHSTGTESAITTVATSTNYEAANGALAHTVEYDNLIAVDLDADDIDQVTIWIRYYMLGND